MFKFEILDDDDNLDERGLLKDGRILRTSMMARDSLSPVQRAIAATHDATRYDTTHRRSMPHFTNRDIAEQAAPTTPHALQLQHAPMPAMPCTKRLTGNYPTHGDQRHRPQALADEGG
jgi:hypothetical protein